MDVTHHHHHNNNGNGEFCSHTLVHVPHRQHMTSYSFDTLLVRFEFIIFITISQFTWLAISGMRIAHERINIVVYIYLWNAIISNNNNMFDLYSQYV